MPAKLTIQSSARPVASWQRILIFGLPDQGKSMSLVTAPDPVWLLTEPTCAGSLSRDNIAAAFGEPNDAEITEWLKANDPKIKPDAIKQAFTANREQTLKSMTGITYDMPRLDIEEFSQLKDAIEILKTGKWKTACIDSGTLLSRMLLEHFKRSGGKGGTPLRDPRQAYKKAADETLDFIRDIFKLPMHIVITAHGKELSSNKGTADEPLWVPYLLPAFEGNVLGREIPHMIREIYRARRMGTKDDGSPRFVLQTRKETEDGYERTLCPRLNDFEEPDLTALFNKILNTPA
jgi:hypothetical protein